MTKKENAKAKNSTIYRLGSINIDEFAIIEEAYDENEKKFNISWAVAFGASSPQSSEILCLVKVSYIQDKIPFMKAGVSCLYEVMPESWNLLIDKGNNDLFLPKNVAVKILDATIGTLRGILHVKTERTDFNKFALPLIDPNLFVEKDQIIKFG